MTPREIQLDLSITDANSDAKRLDQLTVSMMRDLRELGAESVERAPGKPTPDGSKGDPFTIGRPGRVPVAEGRSEARPRCIPAMCPEQATHP